MIDYLLIYFTQFLLLFQICKCVTPGATTRNFDELLCDLWHLLQLFPQFTTNEMVYQEIDFEWDFSFDGCLGRP